MTSSRDGKPLGSLQRSLPFFKDIADYWLARYPRLYLFVEDHRSWVNWEKRVYLSFVRRGDTVLDIGANVGAHTVFLSHLVGERGKVLAFEPVPANIHTLNETIERRSRNSNIRVIPSAVGGPGPNGRQAIIMVPGDDFTQASLRSHSAGSWRLPAIREYHVRLTGLDREREVQDLASIDFVKIDVEGGELDVFKGGAETIRCHRPMIFCEVFEGWANGFGYTPRDLLDFARSLGYSGARIVSQGKLQVLPLDRDPPAGLFEISSDVLFFTNKHDRLVASFDKHYLW